MKSKIKQSENDLKKAYPKLMLNTTYGFVVFFNSLYSGFVIANGTDQHKLGYYSDHWVAEYFEEFHGKVILQN